jgi:ABC-type Fe3+/spermidine/putrescine transport system ATPase subunit
VSRLVLTGVSRRFDAVTAVDGFSLTLAPGEFVSLLGPSGCGKTTTLRMIAGFLAPSEGTIEMDGRLISSPASTLPPEKRGMSMIFQSYAIWPNMTVGQNVGFGLEIRKVSRAEIERRVDKILEVVQMRALKDRYPSELSGGQQQRVALARAIVVEPEILLLDEPLSNLDANLREEMRFEIRRLHDEFKITTVYVTHDQSEAMVTSDRAGRRPARALRQAEEPLCGWIHRPHQLRRARGWHLFDPAAGDRSFAGQACRARRRSRDRRSGLSRRILGLPGQAARRNEASACLDHADRPVRTGTAGLAGDRSGRHGTSVVVTLRE